MTKQTQADNAIHEDQLRNFLVTELTGTFGISIAGNGDIEPEDIYEGLVGATADGISISTLCDRSEGWKRLYRRGRPSTSGRDFGTVRGPTIQTTT